MFDAALFDLDGTLVDTEPRSQRAWRRLFAEHHITVDDDVITNFAGRPGRAVLSEHLHRFPAGSSVDALFAEAMSYATTPAEPMPGALSLLEMLHREGMPIGVVTSGTRDYARRELENLQVLPLLQLIITAEDVTAGKPDPQGYSDACKRLNVSPADVVVFEDSAAGIAAAVAAGTICVGVGVTEDAARTDGVGPEAVVPSLTSVDRAWLQALWESVRLRGVGSGPYPG
jgi:sugar-phosphatase